MIIYWDNIEKSANDDQTIPEYIASNYVPSVHFARNIYWEGQKNKSGGDIDIPQYIYNEKPKFKHCSVYMKANQNIWQNNDYPIKWDVDEDDKYNWHDPATDNEKIIIPEEGLYLITCTAIYNGGTTGIRRIRIQINGVNIPSRGSQPEVNTGAAISAQITETVWLKEDDEIIIIASHNDTTEKYIFGGWAEYSARLKVVMLK